MRALITGVTGQDGHYLSKFLLDRGYVVYGLMRYASIERPVPEGVRVLYGDLLDASSLEKAMWIAKPDEVYNLAAMSHVGHSFESPSHTMMVNAVGTVNLLEILKRDPCRFYQASTSELFGTQPPPQSERTSFHPRSPYGVSKLAAYWATVNYREAYGMFACNGILFNHESPMRGAEFVTQKVCRFVKKVLNSKQGKTKPGKLKLGNLNAIRDWGHAADYVEGMSLMLQQERPGDYVLATGRGRSVEELLEAAFGPHGYSWKAFVEFDAALLRPAEVPCLIGDPSKMRKIGWEPKISFEQMIKEMIDAA